MSLIVLPLIVNCSEFVGSHGFYPFGVFHTNIWCLRVSKSFSDFLFSLPLCLNLGCGRTLFSTGTSVDKMEMMNATLEEEKA